jgi:hypothetical protein
MAMFQCVIISDMDADAVGDTAKRLLLINTELELVLGICFVQMLTQKSRVVEIRTIFEAIEPSPTCTLFDFCNHLYRCPWNAGFPVKQVIYVDSCMNDRYWFCYRKFSCWNSVATRITRMQKLSLEKSRDCRLQRLRVR